VRSKDSVAREPVAGDGGMERDQDSYAYTEEAYGEDEEGEVRPGRGRYSGSDGDTYDYEESATGAEEGVPVVGRYGQSISRPSR